MVTRIIQYRQTAKLKGEKTNKKHGGSVVLCILLVRFWYICKSHCKSIKLFWIIICETSWWSPSWMKISPSAGHEALQQSSTIWKFLGDGLVRTRGIFLGKNSAHVSSDMGIPCRGAPKPSAQLNMRAQHLTNTMVRFSFLLYHSSI